MSTKENQFKVVCFSNHKGGVAKTSSTTNVGAGLATLGYKCLVVDLDPQANLSISMGVTQPEKTIYDCLRGYCEIDTTIVPLLPNLDLIPANLDLSGAEIELSTEVGRECILKGLIEPIRPHYDFILLDCPPSLGLLTINAFTASDRVIIPIQAEFLAIQGLAKLVDVIKKIQIHLNPNLSIGGMLITQFDQRKILNRDVLKALRKSFPQDLFKSKIRSNVDLAEAPSAGIDIFRYNPKSNGATDYLALCKELLQRSKLKKVKA